MFHPLSLLLCLLALSLSAEAGTVRNKIADACSRLTARDAELTKNCVNHAELYELDSGYVNAVVNFHSTVEVRMKALKSGANVDTLNLCKALGWSIDNTLSCMRSYPTPEVIKACKKISPKEDEQLKCIREGRDAAQINACEGFGTKVAERFQCLELDVSALATINCRSKFQNHSSRIVCMKEDIARREEEYRRDQGEMKERELALRADPAYGDPSMVSPAPSRRIPASSSRKK